MRRYETASASNMSFNTSFFDLRTLHVIVDNRHVLYVRIRVLDYTF
jgi:hypothetical protein